MWHQNKAQAKPGNTGYTIGKCSCQQNRLKFQTRRAQLLSTHSRLISAGTENSCLNHMLAPVSPEQHRARAILEEVLRIDLALEIIEQCRNVYHCAPCCQPDQCSCTIGGRFQPNNKTKQSTDYCYDFTRVTTDCDRSGILPEFLLAPMRKSSPMTVKVPKLPGISEIKSQHCNYPNEYLNLTCPCHSQEPIRPFFRMDRRLDYQHQHSMTHLWNRSGQRCNWGCQKQYSRSTREGARSNCCHHQQACRGQPCIGHTTTPGGDRNNENCVLVYGFLPQYIQTIDQIFCLVGDVDSKHLPPDSNWAIFCYKLGCDASQACRLDRSMIERCIIGVTRCTSSNEGPGKCRPFYVPSNAGRSDIGLIRARKNLRLKNGKLEEFHNGDNRRFISKNAPDLLGFEGTSYFPRTKHYIIVMYLALCMISMWMFIPSKVSQRNG